MLTNATTMSFAMAVPNDSGAAHTGRKPVIAEVNVVSSLVPKNLRETELNDVRSVGEPVHHLE